ncbi:hypothetical protein Avbf_09132 [Armadillidium vulgare]|nr:hypothetical protein Avbf_09132 [Armadillidium vulgare]
MNLMIKDCPISIPENKDNHSHQFTIRKILHICCLYPKTSKTGKLPSWFLILGKDDIEEEATCKYRI